MYIPAFTDLSCCTDEKKAVLYFGGWIYIKMQLVMIFTKIYILKKKTLLVENIETNVRSL